MNLANPPSILRLYQDIWVPISHYLDARSIRNLISAGNRQLASTVARSVQSTRFSDFGLILDFEVILNFCQQFDSLEEIIVKTEPGYFASGAPSQALELPSTLTNLDLSFYGVFSLIQPIKLSQAVPSLTRLSLSAHHAPKRHRLSDFDWPPLLEHLSLRQSLSLCISPRGIAQLPRSLSSISLSWLAASSADEDDLKRGFGFQMVSYEWPLSLTALTLDNSLSCVNIEHLPRTLTSLDTSANYTLKSDFPLTSEAVIFPWRVFFPKLRNLVLGKYNDDSGHIRLLRTILLPDALNSKTVEQFISNGFWRDIPSSSVFSHEYPSYDAICLPFAFWENSRPELITELDLLAHLIKNTVFPNLMSSDPLIAYTLPSETHFKGTIVTKENDAPFRAGLLDINAYRSTLHLAHLPASVTSLRCRALLGSNGTTDLVKGDSFPPNLSSLDIHELTPSTVSILPHTLTDLDISLSDTHIWDLVATRCVSLKKLNVFLEDDWKTDIDLASISSRSLLEFRLQLPLSARYANRPKLAQFFRSPSAVWSPILPPSVTRLFLRGGHSIDASVLVVLNLPNLKRLDIAGFVWKSADSPAFPEASGMAPHDLIRCLPQNLRQLRFLHNAKADMTATGTEIIQLLPRSLLQIQDRRHFGIPNEMKTPEFWPLLPPYLQSWCRMTDRMVFENVAFEPSGFLS